MPPSLSVRLSVCPITVSRPCNIERLGSLSAVYTVAARNTRQTWHASNGAYSWHDVSYPVSLHIIIIISISIVSLNARDQTKSPTATGTCFCFSASQSVFIVGLQTTTREHFNLSAMPPPPIRLMAFNVHITHRTADSWDQIANKRTRVFSF